MCSLTLTYFVCFDDGKYIDNYQFANKHARKEFKMRIIESLDRLERRTGSDSSNVLMPCLRIGDGVPRTSVCNETTGERSTSHDLVAQVRHSSPFLSMAAILIFIMLAGCAGSGKYMDPRSEFYVPWGSDKLTFMKAASASNCSYEGTDATGELIQFHQRDYSCSMVARFYDGKYGSLTYSKPYEGYDVLWRLFDRMIQQADSIDNKNRLIFRTATGSIIVEREASLLRFTNSTIAGSE